MRELERSSPLPPELQPLAIVGAGRLGGVLARAFRAADVDVIGPLGRRADTGRAAVVLLCVPDEQIAAAAAAVTPGPLVGHCSGATGLQPLEPHKRFSMHPLTTITGGEDELRGAGAAIDGCSPEARTCALALARALGLRAFEVAPQDRPAYHAAASMASNFLLALEAAAEQVAAGTGLQRQLLVPLVRRTVQNWAALGPQRALTGPIVRGDGTTVAAQRAAVAERAPQLLELFDALCRVTQQLAHGAATSAGADGALSPPAGELLAR